MIQIIGVIIAVVAGFMILKIVSKILKIIASLLFIVGMLLTLFGTQIVDMVMAWIH